MSRVPKTSDPKLENLLSEVVKNTNLDDPRSRAITMEAYQRYIEYVEEIMEAQLLCDTSVTIKIDGKTIRFPNEQAMADFLMELA